MEYRALLAFLCSSALLLACSAANEANHFLAGISPYDRRALPINGDGSGKPMNVKVSVFILDVMRVDDINQELTTQMYFRQSWVDPRLRYDGETKTKHLSFEDVQKIWHPDLFFVDEANGRLNTILFPNTFVNWGRDGNILMSMRISLTTRCKMDFSYYPHDEQTCVFQVESYGYKAEQVTLAWDDRRGPVGVVDHIQVQNFEVTSLTHSVEIARFSMGNYTRLLLKLTIARKPGFFVGKLYIPYVLLVCVSFLSLWISHRLVVPRLSLLLVVLYIMLALASGIQDLIPRVTYTKAIDVWIAFCLSFVFGVFLEFISHVIGRRAKKELQAAQVTEDVEIQSKDGKEESVSHTLFPLASTVFDRNWYSGRHMTCSRRDYASRFIFPTLFGVFTLVYWSVYAS